MLILPSLNLSIEVMVEIRLKRLCYMLYLGLSVRLSAWYAKH